MLPGGNTRSVLHFDPFPIAFVRGEGATLISADGHRYTDLLAGSPRVSTGTPNRGCIPASRRFVAAFDRFLVDRADVLEPLR